jgi:hypothetical protein
MVYFTLFLLLMAIIIKEGPDQNGLSKCNGKVQEGAMLTADRWFIAGSTI